MSNKAHTIANEQQNVSVQDREWLHRVAAQSRIDVKGCAGCGIRLTGREENGFCAACNEWLDEAGLQ